MHIDDVLTSGLHPDDIETIRVDHIINDGILRTVATCPTDATGDCECSYLSDMWDLGEWIDEEHNVRLIQVLTKGCMPRQVMPHEAKVRKACATAQLIAWDGCHRIYLAMDDASAAEFDDYEIVVKRGQGFGDLDDSEDFYAVVFEWYVQSCPLRFIDAITNGKDYNVIVPQNF
jgi:hypothetical protein